MTGSKPRLTVIKKRRALSRRLPRDFASLIHQYAARTGVALWAWNTLHANLFVMFWFLIGRRQDSTLEMAHGVWHTIQNDSTQREMLWQAAVAELAQKPQLLARIEWLLEKSNKLAAYRNIAAHTPAIFSRYITRAPAADPTASREHARQRFNEIDHKRFWRLLAGDLNALARYANRLAFEIYRLGRDAPLPHRPRLLSLAQIDRIEGQIGRLAQSEAQALPKFSLSQSTKPSGPKQKKRSAHQRRDAMMQVKRI